MDAARHCPTCGDEFEAWVDDCLDCGAPLAEGPLPVVAPSGVPIQEPDLEPVRLFAGGTRIEAEVAVGLVRSAGFRAELLLNDQEGMRPHVGQTLGNWMLVDAIDALEIERMLDESDAAPWDRHVPRIMAGSDDVDDATIDELGHGFWDLATLQSPVDAEVAVQRLADAGIGSLLAEIPSDQGDTGAGAVWLVSVPREDLKKAAKRLRKDRSLRGRFTLDEHAGSL